MIRAAALAAGAATLGACLSVPDARGVDGAPTGGDGGPALDHALGSTSYLDMTSSLSLTITDAVAPGARVVALVAWYDDGTPVDVEFVGGDLVFERETEVDFGVSGIDHLATFSAGAPDGLAAGEPLTAAYSVPVGGLGIAAASFTGLRPDSTLEGVNADTRPPGMAWSGGSVDTIGSGALLVAMAMGDGIHSAVSSEADPEPNGKWIEVPAPTGDFYDASSTEAWTFLYQVADVPDTYAASGQFTVTSDQGTGGVVAAFGAQ